MRSVGLSPLSPLLDASPRSDGHPAELVELTLQRTIACAIVEEALGEPSVDRLALLSSLDKSWTATELLELEGHRLNVQCNATLTREEAAAHTRGTAKKDGRRRGHNRHEPIVNESLLIS